MEIKLEKFTEEMLKVLTNYLLRDYKFLKDEESYEKALLNGFSLIYIKIRLLKPSERNSLVEQINKKLNLSYIKVEYYRDAIYNKFIDYLFYNHSYKFSYDRLKNVIICPNCEENGIISILKETWEGWGDHCSHNFNYCEKCGYEDIDRYGDN